MWFPTSMRRDDVITLPQSPDRVRTADADSVLLACCLTECAPLDQTSPTQQQQHTSSLFSLYGREKPNTRIPGAKVAARFLIKIVRRESRLDVSYWPYPGDKG